MAVRSGPARGQRPRVHPPGRRLLHLRPDQGHPQDDQRHRRPPRPDVGRGRPGRPVAVRPGHRRDRPRDGGVRVLRTGPAEERRCQLLRRPRRPVQPGPVRPVHAPGPQHGPRRDDQPRLRPGQRDAADPVQHRAPLLDRGLPKPVHQRHHLVRGHHRPGEGPRTRHPRRAPAVVDGQQRRHPLRHLPGHRHRDHPAR